MTICLYTALVGLALHVLVLLIWFRRLVRQSVPLWPWALGLACVLILVVLHALAAFGGAPSTLSAVSALMMGIALFGGAGYAHSVLRRQAKEKAYCSHLQAAFGTLMSTMQERGQLAENLAVLLNDLHDKIAYYEALAREQGLPLYKPHRTGKVQPDKCDEKLLSV